MILSVLTLAADGVGDAGGSRYIGSSPTFQVV